MVMNGETNKLKPLVDVKPIGRDTGRPGTSWCESSHFVSEPLLFGISILRPMTQT